MGLYEKVREALLRKATWTEDESDCPVCGRKFSSCDHVLEEAQAQLFHDLENAREAAREASRVEWQKLADCAAFHMQIDFHDVLERLPFDHLEAEAGIGAVGNFIVLGIWDPEEPSPSAEAVVVGYDSRSGQWTYAGRFGKPWPYGHRVRYWADMPRITWDEMDEKAHTPLSRADFLSAPEEPEED